MSKERVFIPVHGKGGDCFLHPSVSSYELSPSMKANKQESSYFVNTRDVEHSPSRAATVWKMYLIKPCTFLNWLAF